MKPSLYSTVGENLTRYDVDVEAAKLTRRESLQLISNAQYAWPHPSQPVLYIATSNRGSDPKSDYNHLAAYGIDPESGALTPHGEAQPMRARAVHICVDAEGRFVSSGHNLDAGFSVNRINADGTLGGLVGQPPGLNYGIYPHQVRVLPSNRAIMIVDRGNSAAQGKAEDPGALRVFGFRDGVLSPGSVSAPNGGYGFGPRHVDFHPTKPWVYVSDERYSKLHLFRMRGDVVEPEAAYTLDTLKDRANVSPRQLAGTIHVHPNGRTVYVANRSDYRVEHEGRRVFGGGENSLAVYSIDQDTGEPRLIQHADTQSFHVRTFSIDPSGRLLVAASIMPLDVRDGNAVKTVPAALSVFRIAGDGTLELARKYDVETGGRNQYWMGIV